MLVISIGTIICQKYSQANRFCLIHVTFICALVTHTMRTSEKYIYGDVCYCKINLLHLRSTTTTLFHSFKSLLENYSSSKNKLVITFCYTPPSEGVWCSGYVSGADAVVLCRFNSSLRGKVFKLRLKWVRSNFYVKSCWRSGASMEHHLWRPCNTDPVNTPGQVIPLGGANLGVQ